MENGAKPITQLSQLTVLTGDKGAAVPAVEKVAQFLPDSAAAAAAAAGAAKAKAQVGRPAAPPPVASDPNGAALSAACQARLSLRPPHAQSC